MGSTAELRKSEMFADTSTCQAGGSLVLTVVLAARAFSAACLQLLQRAQAGADCRASRLRIGVSGVLRALQVSGIAFGPANRAIDGAAGPAAEVIVGAARHLVPLVRRSAVLVLGAVASPSAAHLEASRHAALCEAIPTVSRRNGSHTGSRAAV